MFITVSSADMNVTETLFLEYILFPWAFEMLEKSFKYEQKYVLYVIYLKEIVLVIRKHLSIMTEEIWRTIVTEIKEKKITGFLFSNWISVFIHHFYINEDIQTNVSTDMHYFVGNVMVSNDTVSRRRCPPSSKI